MKTMIFGKYYSANSILHRLDARTKIVLTLVWFAALIGTNSFGALGVAFAVLCAVVILSRVPLMIILKSIRPIIYITVFSALINLVFTRHGVILVEFYALRITVEGAVASGIIFSKFLLLGLFASLLSLCTPPLQITDAIERLISPLRHIGLDIRGVALSISIAIRFVPVLYDEAGKIKVAMRVRGVEFGKGGVVKRVKNYMPILLPLITSGLTRAGELSTAMHVRGYGQNAYQKLERRPLKAMDFVAALVSIIALYFVLGYSALMLVLAGIIIIFLALSVLFA